MPSIYTHCRLHINFPTWNPRFWLLRYIFLHSFDYHPNPHLVQIDEFGNPQWQIAFYFPSTKLSYSTKKKKKENLSFSFHNSAPNDSNWQDRMSLFARVILKDATMRLQRDNDSNFYSHNTLTLDILRLIDPPGSRSLKSSRHKLALDEFNKQLELIVNSWDLIIG